MRMPEASLDGDRQPPLLFHHVSINGNGNGLSGTDHAEPGLDGDVSRDVAICGFSIKFPEEATSPETFWKMMGEKRCAMTEFPVQRTSADGFYREKPGVNSFRVRGGHFFKEDPAAFDADFFSISPAEAAAMDPLQRWLLETAYRALENAGMSMESVSDSRTGVYAGSFAMDYMLQLARDPECPPTYAAVGFGLSMLANRLSWFFNLRGPSVALDSACSSTGMATDIACQALRNGSCDMALVAGCNLATAPEAYVWMSNINFLSPDSRCHSFDHRGNGYARGEGVAVMVLKRVADAVRDGDTIRAVIRATGSNEDGRTPGITQPSRDAQERLIRETYGRAGLSMAPTRFFEAHGTGTAIGDPREAQAIGAAFRDHRSARDPLYIGAVKSNIGHLEGASCIAGMIKTVLVLERGVIPPNTNFERLNPKIDADFLGLKLPLESHVWPTPGLRRASVNSFGFGGANAHIVLDDAYNYLRLRSLPGRHATVLAPRLPTSEPAALTILQNGARDREGPRRPTVPRLLVWSAADEGGIQRIVDAYRGWWSARRSRSECENSETMESDVLADLAFTLDSHRSHLLWRSWAVLHSPAELADLQDHISAPARSASDAPRLGFVFSGQGAQWFAMGQELMCFASFRAELVRAGSYLCSLGCPWSVIDELSRDKSTSRVDEAELSQPLCTILQVALVNLLQTFGVRPSAVVGHSSGEIAAAYAGGYLDSESAWRLAYFRGLCCAELARPCEPGLRCLPNGAMMSVGLPEGQATKLVGTINRDAAAFGISIGCVNSPNNVTVSGEEHLVDQLKARLDEQGVFARKLRVPMAYHSPQMEAVRARYSSLIGTLSSARKEAGRRPVPMISSVTGQRISASQLTDPAYWALNMVSPVQFSTALTVACAQSHAALSKKIDGSHRFASVVDHLVEIGPHATLKGPIRDTLQQLPRGRSLGYTSILRRGEPATRSMLQALGELHCLGVPVALRAANEPQHSVEGNPPSRSLLVNLPEYPFDHSQRFWHEGRLSRGYRLRPHAPSEFLGVRHRDWDASEARWRHFIRYSEMPWAEQHVINGTVLYPGTGMLAMAVEGARQLVENAHRQVDGYTLRGVHFEGAMTLSSGSMGTEVQTSLRPVNLSAGEGGELTFEFAIRTPPAEHPGKEWTLNCRGLLTVEVRTPDRGASDWEKTKAAVLRHKAAEYLSALRASCSRPVAHSRMYKFLRDCGYEYGSDFQLARDQRYHDEKREATAEVLLVSGNEGGETPVFHPTSLDAILHLCFTAFSFGGTVPMATSIPTHISRMWISGQGLRWRPDLQSVTAGTSITAALRRGFVASGGALSCPSSSDEGSGELSLWYEGLELTSVTQTPSMPVMPNPRQWYMNMECKVAVDKLTNREIVALLDRLHPPSQSLSPFFQDLEELVCLSLEQLSRVVEEDPGLTLGPEGSWKSRYWSWAHHQLASRSETPSHRKSNAPTQQGLEDIVHRVGETNQVGRVYAQVASSLVAVFKGEVDPLELLIHSGLLKEYYRELAGYRCSRQIATYMDLLAHQSPGLKILEVGGGTGSATRTFVRTLSSALESSDRGEEENGDPLSAQPGSLRCRRYDFTDISPAFAEQAQAEFAHFEGQMSFGLLDVERELAPQGFTEHMYDVVVADNVLHATSDLRRTLRNVRKALKPGGKLLMHEPLRRNGGLLGFVFGLFPGWWLGSEDGRALSPSITPDAWDAVLRETGFSGADMVFRDFDEDDASHHVGWLVATASSEEAEAKPVLNGHGEQSLSFLPSSRRTHRTTLLLDRTSTDQIALARAISSRLGDQFDVQTMDLAGIETGAITDKLQRSDGDRTDPLVMLLADYERPFLSSLGETSWRRLTHLIRTSRRLLWISSNGGSGGRPDQGLIDGFARSMRAEFYELHLVTLALEPSRTHEDAASLVELVAEEMMARPAHQPYEQEYVAVDGRLHTRRLVEARGLKAAMDAKLIPYDVVRTPLDGSSSFTISTSTPGADPTASNVPFVRCPPPSLSEASKDENKAAPAVVITVRAAHLQSQHRTAAPGDDQRPDDLGYTSYYRAGVVVDTSPRMQTEFQPGDRVLALCEGQLGSHVRVDSRLAARIPPQLSFADACAVAPFLMAAHKALCELCRVQQGDRVLVRHGSSPAGRAALLLLRDHFHGVCEVWTTAVDEHHGTWISEKFRIPSDRIVPDAWFADRPAVSSRLLPKFDVVVSQDHGRRLAGSSSHLFLDYLRSGGQYVQLRAGAATSRGNAQRFCSSPSNISVHTLDLTEPYTGSEDPSRHLQSVLDFVTKRAVDLATDSAPASAQPGVHRFSAAAFSDAIERLDKSDGEAIIVEFDEADTVDVRVLKEPAYSLDPDASYLIAGGLGGIGRTMARWLVSRGARHLILLSRSGPKTAEALRFLEDLAGRGVRVETPLCDVADVRALRSVLDACAERMPPIKGCIQCVMVMTELILEKMTFQDWKAAVDPKVRGSWNLHQELPRTLDFFILVSSMMGTIGGGSLSAYSAANSYMDSLARHMVSRGRRAAALALGIVPDSGWLTEHSERLEAVEGAHRYALTRSAEILALLDVYCDPTTPLARDPVRCHAVLGVRPPAHWAHLEEVPFTMEQPLWGHMHHVAPLPDASGGGGGDAGDSDGDVVRERRRRALDAAGRLAAARSVAEAAEIAGEALAQRISALLGTAVDRLDAQKPMHSYGIDSLSAIEVRNWVAQIFGVDLPVFDILGGATLASAGMYIARKVQHDRE